MPEPQVAFTEILGQVIRKRRQVMDITQDVLASAMGITASALSRIESGQSPLTVVQLRSIAECLKVQASDLLRDAEALASRIPRAAPGINIVNERPKAGAADAVGWFLGAAAIAGLVASLAADTDGDAEEPRRRSRKKTRRRK